MPSSSPETNFVRLFTDGFERLGVRYMVTGSVAAMLYGQTRLTDDVDIVAEIPAEKSLLLSSVFPPAEFYCPPPDVVDVESAREQRGHFNIIHIESGYKADLYLAGADVLHAWAFQRAEAIEFAGGRLWLAPPEYVIIRKLEYYREAGSEKHLRDIRMMLQQSSASIDSNVLGEFISDRHLEAEWARVKDVPL